MRDILVLAQTSGPWTHATEYAARLAAMLGGSLTGLWCAPPPNAVIAGDVGAMVAVSVDLPDPELEVAVAAAGQFQRWAASLGVPHSDWLACEADTAAAVRHVGQWHDLLVLGSDQNAPWGGESALAEILVITRRPCLVVPEFQSRPPRLDRIAVAWDGSTTALRALHAAMPLLQRAGRVIVLDGEKGRDFRLSLPTFDLDRYWERHDMAVERVRLTNAVGPIGGALLSEAVAANADLLVMGAFGHTRLREWALGGVSRHMLEHSPIPLLMAH
ncbi:universal stress protein [Lysobacter niastensis]|uniref:Universal stress protein n=1 Tax=Lysobacter niastensis TaxID=380629 RepID=A0ABS0BAZ8_9GAMM|nr:universal stress protein [Lysobacter niastensis]MBF6024844.1 universal stress protein [Lysobacter niastensis]